MFDLWITTPTPDVEEPAILLPEVESLLIIGINMDMTAFDPNLFETFQTMFKQGFSDIFSTIFFLNGQVVNRTTPSIMPSKDCANY